MNPYLKNILSIVSLYITLWGISLILDSISPGGPCAPGLGALFILVIIPLVTLLAFIISLIMLIRKEYQYLTSLIITGTITFFTISQLV